MTATLKNHVLTSLCFLCVSVALAAADSGAAECDTELGCEQRQSWSLTLVFSILLLCVLLVYGLTVNEYDQLPESVCVIVLGVLLGLYLQAVQGNLAQRLVGFDSTMFFLFILPPIIFEQGYSLHKANFFRNLGSIVTFAFIGTMLSTVVVATGLYYSGVVGAVRALPLLDCFIFGSLISAIDPVATLAIFQSLGVDPMLHMLVFGESILNDAVSIVLFRTFAQVHEEAGELETWLAVYDLLTGFVWVSVGSVLVGVCTALFSALLFKHSALRRFASLELSLLFIFAYLPYLLAECLDLSGLMAVLFNGIAMAHYTHHNLSDTTQVTADQLFRVFAFLAETCCFVFLGIQSTSYQGAYDFRLIACTIVWCLIGRAVNVYPLAALINRGRTVKINRRMQFFMWFSGLRGAIAFALALTIPTNFKGILFTTTMGVVLFTIFVFGIGTQPLLRMVKESRSETNERKTSLALQDREMSLTWAEKLDRDYLQPTFRVEYYSDDDFDESGEFASPAKRKNKFAGRATYRSVSGTSTPATLTSSSSLGKNASNNKPENI